MKKSLQLIVLTGMLAAATSVAMASDSLNEFKPQTLSVLVDVNAQGEITDVSPAMDLTPALRRLLIQNLKEVVNKPAVVHGRPVSSQFVANVVLNVKPRNEGDYDASFTYVSGSPLPAGSWYWVHTDHRLTLADRNRLRSNMRESQYAPRSPMRPSNNSNSQPSSPPSKGNASFH